MAQESQIYYSVPARNSQPATGQKFEVFYNAGAVDAAVAIVVPPGLIRKVTRIVAKYTIAVPGGETRVITAEVAVDVGGGYVFNLPDTVLDEGMTDGGSWLVGPYHLMRDDTLTVTLPAGATGAAGSLLVETEIIGLALPE